MPHFFLSIQSGAFSMGHSVGQFNFICKNFFRWSSKSSKMTFSMSDMNGHGHKIIIDEVWNLFKFNLKHISISRRMMLRKGRPWLWKKLRSKREKRRSCNRKRCSSVMFLFWLYCVKAFSPRMTLPWSAACSACWPWQLWLLFLR